MKKKRARIECFEALGMKPDDYVNWFDKEKPKKEVRRYIKKHGVDPRECFNLDTTLIYWFYPRLCCFINDASQCIDMSFHSVEHNGETKTVGEWLNIIKGKFDDYFLFNMKEPEIGNREYYDEEKMVYEELQEAFRIVADLLFYLWW